MIPAALPKDPAVSKLVRNISRQGCCSGLGEARQRSDCEMRNASLAGRRSPRRPKAATIHQFNTSTSTLQPCHEIFYCFYRSLTALSRIRGCAARRFSANTHRGAEPEGPRGKIQYAACLHLPAGDIAANDLAVWRFHRSEERRVGKEGRSRWWPEH